MRGVMRGVRANFIGSGVVLGCMVISLAGAADNKNPVAVAEPHRSALDGKPMLPARRAAGRKFFEEQVLPKIAENGCPACHAVGYVHPNVTQYDELLPYLAMGDAPEKTAVIRKIANLRAIAPDRPTHPGGQRCKTLDSEPCQSIIRWWAVEFGNAPSSNGERK